MKRQLNGRCLRWNREEGGNSRAWAVLVEVMSDLGGGRKNLCLCTANTSP